MNKKMPKILFLVTEDWYFYSHRLPIARAAKDAGYDVLVATRITQHCELIQQEGFRVIPIKLRRKSYNPFVELFAVSELISIYRKERPDIVHHVALKPVLYGSFAAWVAKVPHVVNAMAGLGHLFTSNKTSTSFLRMMAKRAFRFLLNRPNSRTILQNPDDKNTLTSNSIVKPELTRLIKGSGVSLSEYRPFPEPEGELIVILPSRMLWDKGIAEFVEASVILKRKGSKARFVLVGKTDGESPSAIPTSQLEEWNDAGAVEWWGYCGNMPEVYAQAHIICSPTFYGEGVPKALIEAAACGLPIITTDIPGCREIVRNGVNGVLIPPKNVQALVDALELLTGNPKMRREIGARGRHIAIEEFSEQKVVKATLAVYSELSV